ncbi:centrosomal protein of 152 kDa isoform X2 [Hyperolius riggenbachi]|uniref:centrosomal protein of 152 kDa isoform X2 n=1 Tax=Hyperolius riggenbachi TaxID=752182 RepID=UPI0035A32ECF
MSIDFDSGALQTQQNDNEEYDQEDYAREQLLQQLLTDLPHDMLDDSLCSNSEPNYSDCSDQELSEHNQHWIPETQWGDGGGISEHQNKYKNACADKLIAPQYMGQQTRPLRNESVEDKIHNGWGAPNGSKEEMFTDEHNHHGDPTNEESNVGSFHGDDHFGVPDRCSTSELYHLPEDFQPYTNGGHQLGENLLEAGHKQIQMFTVPEGNGDQIADTIPVRYNPYQLNGVRKDVIKPDPARGDGNYEDLQREFLDTGECTSSNMQFVQLQVLYKARGRQLEELDAKLQESERQLRYLNHQLVIVKDEKDGLAISLQESQTMFQTSRELELQLRGQMASLQNHVDGLTSNDEQLRKELKVAKLAMESMQQQVMDLRRSDSINRAREQHEMVVSMLKKKSEEQLLSLQQKLDDVNRALQEQKDICSRLESQLKHSERLQEETKLDKTEIINRLSRSLEESQKQCAQLLHTGSFQEATQLRLQLQQVQSSKTISDGMNKALQEEINELKEQIRMYESAAKLGVYIGEEQEQLSDSYVDLGIKKINWQKSHFQRSVRTNGVRKDLSSDDVVTELKMELERCMTSNKSKRLQIVQLQSDLKASQSKTEELKQLLDKAEKEVKDYTPTATRDQEIQSLREYNQKLQQEVEQHVLHIKELTLSEEKLKAANQQLCTEMREMIQDFDKDKKESIERCERTYEQYHEDIKTNLKMEFNQTFEAEKAQLCQTYESKIVQMQSHISELCNEMTAVQECYIAVCKEKDTLEDTIRDSLKEEFQLNQERALKMELEDKHQSAVAMMTAQWQREREEEIKRQTEIQLAQAKEDWVRQHQQETLIKIQDIENEWKGKLDMALQHARETPVHSLENHAVQTDQSFTTGTEQMDNLKLKLQNAVLDKERAVQQACMELELKHREDLSNQVELAITKARARWLQELTTISEFKAHLQLEKQKWEKLNYVNVKKQISDAVAAAEEKWKLDSEKGEYNFKQKECEEKLAAMQRELDLKTEEFEAQMKVELGKARSQWNKEKQEEIQALREQNEKDFRTFLDDHRSKISDVLSTTKAEFEKQKNELMAQKEAEMTELFSKTLKLRSAEEAKRLHDNYNKILAEVENLMSEIHDELIEKRLTEERLTHVANGLDMQFLQKLRTYLERSVKGIAYKVISDTKEDLKQKRNENEICRDSNISVKGPNRPCLQNAEGAPNSLKRVLTEKVANGNLQTLPPADIQLKKKSENSELCCCENCLQLLEKSKKECQELRSKLDKACRHLQQAVREQKLRLEQFKENEITMDTLRRENLELQKKLNEKKLHKQVETESFLPGEDSEKGCNICRGKALEEMRAQYIKAVDKIKLDMLRYIHESKSRAADMLKSEVLRERQETARKMRKYYLTCLQQLLKDDGRNEGAEKKIMNAASKLATMAKVLETPISHKTQSRNMQAASAQNNETEPEAVTSLKNVQVQVNDRLKAPDPEQRTIDELVRRHLKEKLDGGAFPIAHTSAAKLDEVSNPLRKDCFKASSSPLERQNLNRVDGKADSIQLTFPGHSEPFLHGLKAHGGQEHHKVKSSMRRFELQETPVRDDNGSNDWSSISSRGLFPVQGSLSNTKVPFHNADVPENFTAAGLFSLVEGSCNTFGSRYEGQKHSAHIAKRRDQTPGTRHSSKTMGHPPTAVESKPYSDVGRVGQLPSQKLLQDFTSLQQDSGFDSPFPNLNSFN